MEYMLWMVDGSTRTVSEDEGRRHVEARDEQLTFDGVVSIDKLDPNFGPIEVRRVLPW